MAKQRFINTRFWNDNYISNLDPLEKLLFIYFLTNEHTNICGFYELPLKVIAVETGIDSEMIQKMLPRLEDRIRYIDGMVIVKNALKHQDNLSLQFKKGALSMLLGVPRELLHKCLKNQWYIIPPTYPIDTVSIPPGDLDRD